MPTAPTTPRSTPSSRSCARDDDLMAVRVVIFDFYGTLAEATERGLSWAELFEEMGHTLSPEATHRFWNEGNDGHRARRPLAIA